MSGRFMKLVTYNAWLCRDRVRPFEDKFVWFLNVSACKSTYIAFSSTVSTPTIVVRIDKQADPRFACCALALPFGRAIS